MKARDTEFAAGKRRRVDWQKRLASGRYPLDFVILGPGTMGKNWKLCRIEVPPQYMHVGRAKQSHGTTVEHTRAYLRKKTTAVTEQESA